MTLRKHAHLHLEVLRVDLRELLGDAAIGVQPQDRPSGGDAPVQPGLVHGDALEQQRIVCCSHSARVTGSGIRVQECS